MSFLVPKKFGIKFWSIVAIAVALALGLLIGFGPLTCAIWRLKG